MRKPKKWVDITRKDQPGGVYVRGRWKICFNCHGTGFDDWYLRAEEPCGWCGGTGKRWHIKLSVARKDRKLVDDMLDAWFKTSKND